MRTGISLWLGVWALALGVTASAGLAAMIDATWDGGVGNWDAAALWAPDGVPNNSGGNTYNVFIDGGESSVASEVALNISAMIDALSIDVGDALSIVNGTNLAVAGTSIANGGRLSLNSTGSYTYLYIPGTVTLTGSWDLDASDFLLTGFGSLPGIDAGATLGGMTVELDTAIMGEFLGQIALRPFSENASGYSGALSHVQVTVTGSVVPEPAMLVLLGFGACAAMLRRSRRVPA
jgi:PEP-CTERM motif-containing protein